MTLENDMLEKAGAFEEMVRTNGWKYLLDYIGERVAEFTNKGLSSEGFSDMAEYNKYRGEVIGLQNLLAEVNTTLTHLNNFRNEQSKSTPAK